MSNRAPLQLLPVEVPTFEAQAETAQRAAQYLAVLLERRYRNESSNSEPNIWFSGSVAQGEVVTDPSYNFAVGIDEADEARLYASAVSRLKIAPHNSRDHFRIHPHPSQIVHYDFASEALKNLLGIDRENPQHEYADVVHVINLRAVSKGWEPSPEKVEEASTSIWSERLPTSSEARKFTLKEGFYNPSASHAASLTVSHTALLIPNHLHELATAS